MDTTINKQIYDYNESVRRSNQSRGQVQIMSYKVTDTNYQVAMVSTKYKNNRREKTIVFKPMLIQDFRKTKEDLANKLNPCDFEINSVTNTSNGGVVIQCKTREAKESLGKQAQLVLGDTYNIINQSLNNPRIKILGISCKSDEICKTIVQQNDFINQKAVMKLIRIEIRLEKTPQRI